MATITKSMAQSLKTIPPSNELGFGKYFTDHMFIAKYKEGLGWYEKSIVPYGPLSIDPSASVLHYGQALFEGLKAYRQTDGQVAFFRPEYNQKRMADGAERLCLQAPPLDLFMEGLNELVKVDERWVPSEPNTSLYIRPTLIGAEGFLGVRPSKETIFFIILSPVGAYYSGGFKPVKIWCEEKHLRAAPGGLGNTKAGANYAASLKAGEEAKKNGYSQVLWLDVEHKGIEEVGTMNVFFVFKDEVVTPALEGTILAGGTRDSVIQLLKHKGKKIVERKITITEVIDRLNQGDLLEMFGTGTAAVISPVGALNYKNQEHVINGGNTGSLSVELFNDIVGIQSGKIKDEFGWIVKLK